MATTAEKTGRVREEYRGATASVHLTTNRFLFASRLEDWLMYNQHKTAASCVHGPEQFRKASPVCTENLNPGGVVMESA